jgi:hypothetical protein
MKKEMRDLSTEENRKFWEAVDRDAAMHGQIGKRVGFGMILFRLLPRTQRSRKPRHPRSSICSSKRTACAKSPGDTRGRVDYVPQ